MSAATAAARTTSTAPAPTPVSRETFGIPSTEDPWSQVPDPNDPLVTASAYFNHFLQDNGGLRKENDGEPRRYANVFFDFRRGRSKFYRDVLGIDNGKVSTLASQDWQLVKSTEYGKKFWKQVADETARLYDSHFPGQRQRQPIYPTVMNRNMPLAPGALPSVLAPPLPTSPPSLNRGSRPAPINVGRRRSTSHAQNAAGGVHHSPTRPRTMSTAGLPPSPAKPSPRYAPYALSTAGAARMSPSSMHPIATSLPTHYESRSHPSPIYYATPSPATPMTPVAPPPHVLPPGLGGPLPAPAQPQPPAYTSHVHPPADGPSTMPESTYPNRSLSMDTSSLQPPNMQLQRHSLDMGVFAYEGASNDSSPSSVGAPSWPPQTTSTVPTLSPSTNYFPIAHPTPLNVTYGYTTAPTFTYMPPGEYSPNPACAPVTHINPTLFAGSGPRWYDQSQGISPTCINPDLPRTNSAPMLAGEYEGYHPWTPEMQL